MMRNFVMLASLAINIFLIGLIVGGNLPGAPKGKPPMPRQEEPARSGLATLNNIMPIRALQTLPPEQRQHARATIKEFLPKSRALQVKIAEKRKNLTEVLLAAELNEEELKEAVSSLQELQFEQQRLTADTMAKVLIDLPDAERIALLIRIETFKQRQREERQGKVREKIRDRMEERQLEEVAEPQAQTEE